MANAVKKTTTQTNVVALDPSFFEADANEGLGQLGQDDLAIPFLRILSDTSPQVKKRDPQYVDGAEVGMMYNTLTKELYDGEKGVNVIPCSYQRQYIEWQDRGTSTGAPVAIHDADSDIVSQPSRGKDYKDRLPNGNYVEKTANHFVIVTDKTPCTALISKKSTQLNASVRV